MSTPTVIVVQPGSKVVIKLGELIDGELEMHDGEFEVHYQSDEHPDKLLIKETGGFVDLDKAILYEEDLSMPESKDQAVPFVECPKCHAPAEGIPSENPIYNHFQCTVCNHEWDRIKDKE